MGPASRRGALAALALALSVFGAGDAAHGASDAPLDPAICAVIADYDARGDRPGLLAQFEAMAFRHEWCAEAGGPCETATLARRERDFEVAVIAPGLTPQDPRRRVLGANLDYAARVIGGATGLRVTPAAGPDPARVDDTVVLLAWTNAAALRALRASDGAAPGLARPKPSALAPADPGPVGSGQVRSGPVGPGLVAAGRAEPSSADPGLDRAPLGGTALRGLGRAGADPAAPGLAGAGRAARGPADPGPAASPLGGTAAGAAGRVGAGMAAPGAADAGAADAGAADGAAAAPGPAATPLGGAAAPAGADPAPPAPPAVLAAIRLGLEAGLGCFVRPAVAADGTVGAGVIFVAVDRPAQAIAACVKEELFNYLGLFADPIGDAALFADPWGRDADDPTGVLFVGYSVRDYALLRLLHDPAVAPGMARAEVMARLAARVAEGC